MFTSVTDLRRKQLRQAFVYFGVALFCVFFAVIYESFSHGVYSYSMIFMFAYPLTGCVISAVIAFSKLPIPPRFAVNAYNSAVAAFTVGSCISGILEIYGTTSYYNFAYIVIGIILFFASASAYIMTIAKSRQH